MVQVSKSLKYYEMSYLLADSNHRIIIVLSEHKRRDSCTDYASRSKA